MPNENMMNMGAQSGVQPMNQQPMAARPKKPGKMVRKKPYVTAIVILAILAVGGIGFGVTELILNMQANDQIADLEGKKNSTTVIDEIEVVEGGDTSAAVNAAVANLRLTDSKYLGDGDRVFTISSNAGLSGTITLRLSSGAGGGMVGCDGETPVADKATLSLSVVWDEINEWYNLGREKTGVASAEDVEITGIDPEHVVDARVGMFGQSVGKEMLLFLMDDGTVEYIPMAEAAKTGDFSSRGKIEGVDGAIVLKDVSVSDGCGGGRTVIAQKANGEFYNLYDMLGQ